MANVTINSSANGSQEAFLAVDHANGSTGTIKVITFSSSPIIIDWGDGATESLISGVSTSHIFSSVSTVIKLSTAGGLEDIRSISTSSIESLQFNGDIAEFKQFIKLESLILFTGLLSGIINNIPKTLTTFEIYYQIAVSNISGNIANLPPNIQFLVLQSNSIIEGNVNNFPKSLISIAIINSKLSGDIINLPPSLLKFELASNTDNLTGNIINLPIGLFFLYVRGTNTLTGDVKDFSTNITFVFIEGTNTLYGQLQNLPLNIISFIIEGNNIIDGNLSSINSSDLDLLQIYGNNTISGNLADINKYMTLTIYGNNTITGNLSDLKLRQCDITGNNTITGSLHTITVDYLFLRLGPNTPVVNSGNKTFSSSLPYFQLVLEFASIPPADIDRLINDLYAAGLTSEVSLNLKNATRTSASDTAYTAITSGGGFITLT